MGRVWEDSASGDCVTAGGVVGKYGSKYSEGVLEDLNLIKEVKGALDKGLKKGAVNDLVGGGGGSYEPLDFVAGGVMGPSSSSAGTRV